MMDWTEVEKLLKERRVPMKVDTLCVQIKIPGFRGRNISHEEKHCSLFKSGLAYISGEHYIMPEYVSVIVQELIKQFGG